MAEIPRLLASAIEKLASTPSTLIDLVVTPSSKDDEPDVAALLRFVEEHGGQPVRVKPDAVQLRLPVREVKALASSGLAASMRMARLATMH